MTQKRKRQGVTGLQYAPSSTQMKITPCKPDTYGQGKKKRHGDTEFSPGGETIQPHMISDLYYLPKLSSATGRWFVFFSVRNPMNGKMKRYKIYSSLNSVNNLEDKFALADRLIKKYSEKLIAGWLPQDLIKKVSTEIEYNNNRKLNQTWEKVLPAYLEEIRPALRYGTYTTYKSKISVFLRFLQMKKIAQNDISATNNTIIKEYYAHLFNDRHNSNKMINHHTRLFKKICNDLIIQKIIHVNYFKDVPKYQQLKVTPQVLPDHLLYTIKDYFIEHDPQMWTILQFIFYCFIRPIELRFTRLKYIDFNTGYITIPANISKNKKTQRVIIPDHFLEYLTTREYNRADPDFYIFTFDGKPGPVPLSKNFMWRKFDLMRQKLGISKDYKFYSFKHTGGLKLWKSGADPIDIKTQFRHHSLDQVLDYIRALEGQDSPHIRKQGFVL